ncbi:MAG: hypothetical protein KDD62_16145, partial [Bdellovibrionales bacterium]|nr:hypothetical protein [Bdellovibrionales bacterium]
TLEVYRRVLPYATELPANAGIINLLADTELQQQASEALSLAYKNIERAAYPQSETNRRQAVREGLKQNLAEHIGRLFKLELLDSIDRGYSPGFHSNTLRSIAGIE